MVSAFVGFTADIVRNVGILQNMLLLLYLLVL